MGQEPFSHRAGRGTSKSLAHRQCGARAVSHAQNKFPIKIKFKSAATALTLCLVFQVQADTLLGRVIHVADGDTILDDTHPTQD